MSTIPKLWENSVIKEYLTPESHQKSQEQFLKTHIDIDKIRSHYLFPHSGSDEFVTQEEFRDGILKSEVKDDNRIFILRGETGSGKSQLCQWLEYQIGRKENEGVDDTHVALHVSRSKTGIGDILDIISGPIDTDTNVSNVEDLNPEKVADAIITTLRAFGSGMERFTEDEIEKLTADRPSSVDLRSILIKNIKEYQEAATSEGDKRKTDLITEKDYRDLSITAFGSAEGSETLFPALQSQVHTILSQNLGVQDFQGKLEELSKEYAERGLRPVLICEDLTTFSVLKEQLLDHIFQLDSGHYDVVLGWTSGWEKDQLSRALGTSQDTDTYMEDRAEGYLSTTDDNGQAYFLDEDVTVELARKYMSVIRSESDTAETLDDDTLAAFDDLYPFNPEFIEQSYNHLIQDGNQRRTPRLLLIRVIRECLSATVPPYEAIEDNPYVEPFPTPLSDLSYSNEVDKLAKWYGSATSQGQLRVQNGVLDIFDVEASGAEHDEDWTYFQADVAPATLSLALVDGTLQPEEEIKIRTTLNSRGEPDVAVLVDGEQVALTNGSGYATLALPDKEGQVRIVGEKDDIVDELELTVERPDGDDNLSVTANPMDPTVGGEVEVTTRLNGEPESGVTISLNGEEIGRTGNDGKFQINAPEGNSAEITAETNGVEDSVIIEIIGTDITIPVGTDLEPTKVKERLLEYQNWVKNGEQFDSSTTLRDGAAGVLNEWHDPTLLGNKNATNDGVNGIYYTRGSKIPVSIMGTDERQGLSFDLNFGVKYDDIYKPLFWYGISNDGEFPQGDKYAINYDLLRAWTDEQVADFRMVMREEIESCLPESMTIEELIVLSQFLVLNATTGRDEIETDMVFEKPPQSGDSYVPGVQEDQPSDLVEATNELLRSRSVPFRLAEGFFLLKSNVVDYRRLNDAVKKVDSNLNRYLKQAMMIDASDLLKAYQVSTTRSTGYTVKTFLKRVKTYATELDTLTTQKNAAHVQENVKEISSYYDAHHDRDELEETLDRLHNVINTLDITKHEKWNQAVEQLEDGSELDLGQFRRSMQTFKNLSEKSGHELISALHAYHSSRDEEVEWKIYETIAEMIEEAEDKQLPGGEGFRKRVSDLSELETYEERRNALKTKVGGE